MLKSFLRVSLQDFKTPQEIIQETKIENNGRSKKKSDN